MSTRVLSNAFQNSTADKTQPKAQRMAVKTRSKSEKTWAETAGTGDRHGLYGLGGTIGKLVAYTGTVALLLFCPVVAIYLWYTLTKLDGSISAFVAFVREGGLAALYQAWPKPSLAAWKIVGTFGALEAFLQYTVPGSTFLGPVSPKGNVPVYKANGLQSYATTLALFFAAWRFNIFQPALVYDLFGEILAALSAFSLLFCLFLFIKGRTRPSSSDHGTTGSIVYDYFWGMELYPRIGKHFDLKVWTNCRMGMMSWAILPLCFAAKQLQATGSISNSMLVSVGLMEVYVFKFFLWETGYLRTMDIAHDRAGYYLCWGCLVWVPSVYTSPALFLASHPYQLPTPVAAAIFMAGVLSIYINYDSDRQRQVFRATEGKAPVWGAPPKIIVAKYKTGDGKEANSLLLASGWWGLSRHFHYVPEILAATFWTMPALFNHPLVWFYVFFLTLLLTDRSYRDDVRCASKYGSYWKTYCKAVPYRMIPYIF